MPQFEFSSAVLWSQLAWLAFFFAILYFAVVRPTLPKLGRVMSAREDQIGSDVDHAAKAKAEADRIQADYAAGVASAQESARARAADAKSKAAATTEQALANANAKLDDQAANAATVLETARTKALVEIQGVSADLAADMVEKLTGTRPSAGDAAAAVRAAF